VVVGAGTAGCVVAATLSDDPANEVVLLESGDDRWAGNRPAAVTSLDWSGVFDEPDLWWPGLVATRRSTEQTVDYLQGRGVGGSSSVNGMLALPGLPSDYDRWLRVHGCVGWSWNDVAPRFARLRAHCRQASSSELGPLDRMLARAAQDLELAVDIDLWEPGDGMGRAWLQAADDHRRSSAELWLDPARWRSNLIVRARAEVDRLVLDDDRCRGVQLGTGEVVLSDHVVLCAGAIGSPVILMRSGVRRPGLGANLREHPSLHVTVTHQHAARPGGTPPIASVLRLSSSLGRGDLHVMPLGVPDDAGVGRLIVACMQTTSQGWVAVDRAGPGAIPRIHTNELSTADDRTVLADARAWLERLLATPTLSTDLDEVGDVVVDGVLYHAAGTCRMGPPSDPMAVVRTDGRVAGLDRVHVMDASVFPDLPAAGPHLAVVMLASRLAQGLRTSWATHPPQTHGE